MFHHLLIGYDGSANAKKALEYGIDFAMHADAMLTIVTVAASLPEYVELPQRAEIAARLARKARQIAEMAAEQVRACNIEKLNVEVPEGAPAESLLAVAEARGCDCVVVGARGRDAGQWAGLLLGSVSDRLAQHAKIPVLIVR